MCIRDRDTIAPDPTPNSWAAESENEVLIAVIKMEANAIWEMPLASKETTRSLYVYEGEGVKIEDVDVALNHGTDLDPSLPNIVKNGNTPAALFVLQGRPINEPVAQHGPFVMNTQQEIREAFSEFQRTQFGGWQWSSNAPVHEREKGRFAIHIDGKVEEKA